LGTFSRFDSIARIPDMAAFTALFGGVCRKLSASRFREFKQGLGKALHAMP
jgi:hypothetical protein